MTGDLHTGLKRQVALGAASNLLFAAGGGVLAFVQFMIVVRLVTPEDIGLFAVAAAVALTIELLSDFGIGDRLVQIESNVREAYRQALTLQILLTVILWLAIVGAAPLIAGFYQRPFLNGLLVGMSYAAFSGLSRLPLCLLLKRLQYFQHRLIVFAGRCAGFIVTLAFAYGDAGVWSLVAGGVTTTAITSLLAWKTAGAVPSIRLSAAVVRQLVAFSWPVWSGRLTLIVVQHGVVLMLSLILSTRDLGLFKSAEQIATFIFGIDAVLGQTLFPALCRVKDSGEALRNAFTKTSRISMIWMAGGGVALYVFADRLVADVLSDQWRDAAVFVRAYGIALLFGGTISNWDVVFKARGSTRPVFHVAAVFMGCFAFLFCPLTWLYGRNGAAVGLVLVNLVTLVARKWYLDTLRIGISLFDISRRALTAAAAAGLVVWAVRVGMRDGQTITPPLVELALYGVTHVAVLAWLEASLIREVVTAVSDGGRRARVPALT
jgi:O-antigen/teichoic acid export membrane protein